MSNTMYKIMSGYTLACYFLSIIFHWLTRTTELFVLFDSNNDISGVTAQGNSREKK